MGGAGVRIQGRPAAAEYPVCQSVAEVDEILYSNRYRYSMPGGQGFRNGCYRAAVGLSAAPQVLDQGPETLGSVRTGDPLDVKQLVASRNLHLADHRSLRGVEQRRRHHCPMGCDFQTETTRLGSCDIMQ